MELYATVGGGFIDGILDGGRLWFEGELRPVVLISVGEWRDVVGGDRRKWITHYVLASPTEAVNV